MYVKVQGVILGRRIAEIRRKADKRRTFDLSISRYSSQTGTRKRSGQARMQPPNQSETLLSIGQAIHYFSDGHNCAGKSYRR